MIDPKVVEMQVYNTLPHLVIPVVTDPKKVLLALRWVIDEMEKRYKIFAKAGVRNITGFNARPKKKTQKNWMRCGRWTGEEDEAALQSSRRFRHQRPREDDVIIPDHMPYIVIIIDELADLMQTAPADVESAIARITQMARAAGIHLIVATQTPRADVITGVIKANIPSRIAFQVASQDRQPGDSRRERRRSIVRPGRYALSAAEHFAPHPRPGRARDRRGNRSSGRVCFRAKLARFRSRDARADGIDRRA